VSKIRKLIKNNVTQEIEKQSQSSDYEHLEQVIQFEKRIYDLEQLLDIAKSFCQELDFNNLMESIVYICMAQMHTLGAEIFVRDLLLNEKLVLETSKNLFSNEERLSLLIDSPVVSKLGELNRPISLEELKASVDDKDSIRVLECLSPTLIVPLIQKNHLNGVLLLQERIAIEDDTSYTDYEKNLVMSIASLASVAINNASLLEISSTDMMTHLKLKFYFFNALTQAIDTAVVDNTKVAVLMFDIDFFKKFNDTYGHECGDFVLIGVAEQIKGSLREIDIASRYGGEEFTVLLNNTAKEEAMLVAERIRLKIESHDFIYNGQHLKVTISGGVSVFDSKKNPVKLPNEFINQADQALYESKQNGRNRVTLFKSK
jgi:diguanylate cyclase (GGDEF)-like protein